MLGLYVRLGDRRTQRFGVAGDRYTIGSDGSNHLVLRDGGVRPFHSVLAVIGGIWKIRSADRSGDEPGSWTMLHAGARIEAGRYTVTIVTLRDTREPVEHALLAAIVAGDAASRMVYADWLETRGELASAEFLRLQEILAGIDATDSDGRERFRHGVRRLRELAAGVDVSWRRLVARPAVEGCRRIAFDFQCAQDWGTLQETADPGIRRCTVCDDNVHYAETIHEARELAAQGRCVVVDLVQLRRPGDLDPPRRIPAPGMLIVR